MTSREIHDPLPVTVKIGEYRQWYKKTYKKASFIDEFTPIAALAVSGNRGSYLVLVQQDDRTWYMPPQFINEDVFDLLDY